MKRYLIFAGFTYYPAGGMLDYKNSVDTSREAIDVMYNLLAQTDYNYDWGHIYDSEEKKIVHSSTFLEGNRHHTIFSMLPISARPDHS